MKQYTKLYKNGIEKEHNINLERKPSKYKIFLFSLCMNERKNHPELIGVKSILCGVPF
jgi:hypothetical protein